MTNPPDLHTKAVSARPPMWAFSVAMLDWFLTDGLRNDAEAGRRARLVVASSLVLLVVDLLVLVLLDWMPGVEVSGVWLPPPAVSGIALSALFHFGVAFTVKRTGSADSAAFLLTSSLIIFFGFAAYFQGGFSTPVTWWITAIPIFSAFVSGPRTIVLTAAVSLSLLFGLYGLEVSGHPFPQTWAGEDGIQDVLRAQVGLLGFVTFFGWYYEQTRQDASRDLVQAYTDLERTNAALRMSQLNVRQIAENIGQALWMHDLRTDRVVYANAAFDEVFGTSRRDLARDGWAWRAVIHPSDVGGVPRIADDRDHVYRLVIDDEIRWVRHSIYPVGDTSTPYHRVIHIVADITLKRNAEAMREQYLETVQEVQINERRHLARELHDETGQSLTALLVGLRSLANTLKEDAQKEFAAQLAEHLRGIVGDIARLARGLHPSVLDELGMVAAIQRLAEDCEATHEVSARLQCTGRDLEDDVSPVARLAIYRIVQEALTNVGRHANARNVDISLTIQPHVVAVRVEDDGEGFDPSSPQPTHELSSGLGLMGMKERASILGGEVTVESAPGRGTTVQGQVPARRSARSGLPATS